MILCLALLRAAARRLPAAEHLTVNDSETFRLGLREISAGAPAPAAEVHS